MVALRKESVDRNRLTKKNRPSVCSVALRKESVDRNAMRRDFRALGLPSLSARRAWIEISTRSQPSKPKESLSARRAWIEMPVSSGLQLIPLVALRKESVDRNYRPYL